MQKGITIHKSTEQDIMGIMLLLRPTHYSNVSVSEIKNAIREGKSVVAKNETGEIIGHNILFETRDGDLLDSVHFIKSGYQLTLREMADELVRIKRGDTAPVEYMPYPGMCGK